MEHGCHACKQTVRRSCSSREFRSVRRRTESAEAVLYGASTARPAGARDVVESTFPRVLTGRGRRYQSPIAAKH
jgi:hypothetical protein